jgi:two-component system copper resistance phosphate regulon response regulator CusR
MKILLVEDEPKLAQFMEQGLTDSGYEVSIAYDGQMGRRMAMAGGFDVMIFDVIIPYINGLELCKEVRAKFPDVPIILLTALGSTEDKVLGLDAGADDYLVKPFEFKELLARIRSHTRRSGGIRQSGEFLEVGDLKLDMLKKVAVRGGKQISLTAKEFLLLELLMRNAGRVIDRSEIAEKVWELNFDTGTNVVDVYVNMLRKKVDREFERRLIHTRVGLGYILEDKA